MKHTILFLLGIFSAALSTTAQTVEWKNSSSLSFGKGFAEVTSPAESLFVAVGGYGRIARSTDGGETWSDISSGLPAVWESDLADVSFGTASTGMAVGSSGNLVQTTDGGVHWTPGSPGGVQGYLSSVFFLDENFGVIASPFLLKTRDGGKNWDQRILNIEGGVYDILLIDTSLVFGVGPAGFSGAGTIFRSDDGGETWNYLNTEGLGLQQLYRVAFADREHGLIVGSNGTVIRTENGGTTWILSSSGVSADLFGLAMKDAMEAVAVGAGGTIIRTTDGGATWQQEISPTDSTLMGVSIDRNGDAVAVGGVESGIILYSRSVPTGVEEAKEGSRISLGVAPNPARGDVRITCGGGEGTIVIRDLLGQEVARFTSVESHSSFLWNTKEVPAGIYFVTLTVNQRKETRRVQVVD